MKKGGTADLETGFYVVGETMKLNFFFVLFDLLILLVYPFAFAAGKLRQISKIKR